MGLGFIKNISSEKKMFYIFLFIHFVVWSFIGLIRTVLPTDSLEGIYWGSLADFGTPKHPPLAGWLSYLAYIPFKLDISIYLISQSFILLGFIYIYKLAKKFLDENQAALSVIILEGCWCYSYVTGYYGFNPDVILLGLLPLITYVFYNCMKYNKPADWIKFGLIVGISFLNKYQTALTIISMAVWAMIHRRETFKNKFFYISIVIAFLIFLPHLLWLIKYDFFPFMYFEEELYAPTWINHITAPLGFLFMQLVMIIGTLLLYGLLRWKSKQPLTVARVSQKEDLMFLLILGFGPLLIHVIMGLFQGGTMRPRWGYEFWYMLGIILFYFFPIKTGIKEYKFTLKMSYIVMFIIFLSLGTLLAVEKNYRSRYPVSLIYNDIQEIWHSEYSTPLKYIGGYIEWTLPLTIYADTHPDCILDTFGYKNPWIDEADLRKNGIFVLDRTEIAVINQTRLACPCLTENYEIKPKPYKFKVKNAFGQEKEYLIFYFIVPPEKI